MKKLHFLWLLALLTGMFTLTACEEQIEEDEKQESGEGNKNETNATATISPSGGNVEVGDISIDFPSGTFTSDAKVTVSEMKSGEILGEDEISKFYQVTIPLDFRKSVEINIKSSSKDTDAAIVFHAPVVATHSLDNEITYTDIALPTSYANGVYHAKIPAANNVGETNNISMSFGLAHTLVSYPSEEARAIQTRSADDGIIIWHVDWTGLLLASDDVKSKVEAEIHSAMIGAIRTIKALGFKVKGDRDIPIHMCAVGLKPNEYGCHNQSCISDSLSTIYLNYELLTGSGFDKKAFRRTVFHELFHYFQSAYDPSGTAAEKCKPDYQPERLRIMEAGGVWIEKLADEKGLYDGQWAIYFRNVLRGILDEGLKEEEGEKKITDHFQGWGYGSAIVLDWFEYKVGKEKIVKMYETWRDKKTNPFKAWISACEKACGVEFFNKFSDFIEVTSKGDLNAGIDWSKIELGNNTQRKFTLFDFKDSNMTYDFSFRKNDSLTKKDIIYHYGIVSYIVWMGEYKNSDGSRDIKGKKLTFTQAQEKVVANVWKGKEKVGTPTYIGSFSKDNPLVITDESILKSCVSQGNKNYDNLFIVVEQDNSKQIAGTEITVKLEDDRSDPTIEPDTLEFEAEGGERAVEFCKGSYKYRGSIVEESAKVWLESWFGAAEPEETKLTATIIAKPNTSSVERSATITYWVSDVENPTESQRKTVTLKVTQKGNNCIFDFVKYVKVEFKGKMHYESDYVSDGGFKDEERQSEFGFGHYLIWNGKVNHDYQLNVSSTSISMSPSEVWETTADKRTGSINIRLQIDPDKGVITSLSAKGRSDYWVKNGNKHTQWGEAELEASNIPFVANKGWYEAVGDKSNGTTINTCKKLGHDELGTKKWTWEGQDDYKVTVTFMDYEPPFSAAAAREK